MQYDLQIPDNVRTQLDTLPATWDSFLSVIDEAASSLEQAKGNFREKVRGMVDAFGRKVVQVSETFAAVAPFSSASLATDAALAVIVEQKAVCADVRKRAVELKAGMDIFNILQPPYKEVGEMEKSLDMLTGIWTLVKEWETSYNTWKLGKFKDIQVMVRHYHLPCIILPITFIEARTHSILASVQYFPTVAH